MTQEQIEQVMDEIESDIASNVMTPAIVFTRMKRLIQAAHARYAGGESEPVAFGFTDMLTGELRDFSLCEHSVGMVPLYTHPQSPAVPQVPKRMTISNVPDQYIDDIDFAETYEDGWNDCRDAMLSAAKGE